AHEAVSRHAGLLAPPRAEAVGIGGLLAQFAWAMRGVWLDSLSVRDPAATTAAWMPWAVLLVLAPALGVAAATAAGRARLAAAGPWLGWALVWSGLAVLPLATFMPLCSSDRH